TNIDTVEAKRLKVCLKIFERRQELPLWRFPTFFGKFEELPTDFRTLSKYCQAVEELMTCFGENFTKNCVDGFSDETISRLTGRNASVQFTFIGERNLCPNAENNVTIENLSCLVNTTKYMDPYHYKCMASEELNSTQPWMVAQEQIMTCQLITVDGKCGRNMSKTLCQVFESGVANRYLQWPTFEYSCDTYMNNKSTETFYTPSGYPLESNCTGDDRQASLECIHYANPVRLDNSGNADKVCQDIATLLECFSKISNKECFAPDVFAEDQDSLPTDPTWTDLLMNINMCGNGSEQDLANIGCLFWRQLYYTQQCGTFELDNCQKRLESVQCRVKYVQSTCNTATAMKLCENYIIDGDHCVDTVTQCRNMTFEKNKGLLARRFKDYVVAFYDSDLEQSNFFISYDYELNESKRYVFQYWVSILIGLFTRLM
ncbi:hypothetical protein FO519_008635, partial [Halicephalobus sp. NKZ332]